MLRVCRPGGRIGLANWTPAGFVGQLFKVIGTFLPPPAGVLPPAAWGTEERLHALFSGASSVVATPRSFAFRYRSAAHWLDVFRTYYGPVHKAFLALDDARAAALEQAMLDLLGRFQRDQGPGLVVDSEYLEVVVTR